MPIGTLPGWRSSISGALGFPAMGLTWVHRALATSNAFGCLFFFAVTLLPGNGLLIKL